MLVCRLYPFGRYSKTVTIHLNMAGNLKNTLAAFIKQRCEEVTPFLIWIDWSVEISAFMSFGLVCLPESCAPRVSTAALDTTWFL
jgi:hypothetical protein